MPTSPVDVREARSAASSRYAVVVLPCVPVIPYDLSAAAGSTLWRHVALLSDRCRALLRVIAFTDRPDYAELSRALGMPQGSIGPTRGRCLAKLRLTLAADPAWETP